MDNKMMILAAAGVVLFCFFLVQCLKSKSPLKCGFVSMIFGVAALIGVNMAGIMIAVNFFTVLVSLTLGIPGVVLILILYYFF